MMDDIEGAPLVEETAAPEAMPDDQPAQEAPPPVEQATPEPQHERQPSVPVAELTRERRAFQARMEAQERQFNERLGMMARELDGLRTPKPAEPEIKVPDPSSDLMGYLDAHRAIDRREQQKLAQQLEDMQRHHQQQQMSAAEQARDAQMVRAYQMEAYQFSQTHPDFGPAYNAWRDAKISEWLADGYSPEEAAWNMQLEERAAVSKALQTGRSPAESIYNRAKRYFTAPAAPEPPRAPNGQFAAAKPPTPAPKSLSQTRGTPGGQNATDDILSMSDAEFRRRFCSDNDKDAFKKLWG